MNEFIGEFKPNNRHETIKHVDSLHNKLLALYGESVEGSRVNSFINWTSSLGYECRLNTDESVRGDITELTVYKRGEEIEKYSTEEGLPVEAVCNIAWGLYGEELELFGYEAIAEIRQSFIDSFMSFAEPLALGFLSMFKK